MELKSDFIQQLRTSFPGLKNEPLETIVAENLISPFSVQLPSPVLKQAQDVVSLLFSMREKQSYRDHYKNLLQEKGLTDPGNKSIMMSYDFHLDENENLKLIEINTNAAFLALGSEMYKMKGLPQPVADFTMDEIRSCIETELKLQGKNVAANLPLAIIDEKPSEQRLFVEFLVYNELFKSWGWDSRILDYRDTFKDFKPDFIYNRYTDFFLNDASSTELKESYLSKKVCLSPNPYEYFLLADKQRLIDWAQPGFLESHGFSNNELKLLRTALPKSFDLRSENAEELWAQRKTLFFKPKNAFGSKQSYKGASVSNKVFKELIDQDIIAQEYIPAPEKNFETPNGPQDFKFDLRCYAYQGRLQLIVARLYQGQVTNLRTPFGGFAAVIFS
ncbi:hypothetical protein [Bdellovibrio reynosensis]|uniref:Glutathionylspermidine synthase pre-ATP-grasp-like domain-containing protein n=1 Tax=Bdellovibrio reynosensis TaxID=2835041 RepID=A0ABY4CAN1_9BACT|nr:hypothetical protein [Bdellovibrio reynosensis]UOF00746.1 hypothetical protein MNR06_13670 [Bdellovibrio reynosensis]